MFTLPKVEVAIDEILEGTQVRWIVAVVLILCLFPNPSYAAQIEPPRSATAYIDPAVKFLPVWFGKDLLFALGYHGEIVKEYDSIYEANTIQEIMPYGYQRIKCKSKYDPSRESFLYSSYRNMTNYDRLLNLIGRLTSGHFIHISIEIPSKYSLFIPRCLDYKKEVLSIEKHWYLKEEIITSVREGNGYKPKIYTKIYDSDPLMEAILWNFVSWKAHERLSISANIYRESLDKAEADLRERDWIEIPNLRNENQSLVEENRQLRSQNSDLRRTIEERNYVSRGQSKSNQRSREIIASCICVRGEEFDVLLRQRPPGNEKFCSPLYNQKVTINAPQCGNVVIACPSGKSVSGPMKLTVTKCSSTSANIFYPFTITGYK